MKKRTMLLLLLALLVVLSACSKEQASFVDNVPSSLIDHESDSSINSKPVSSADSNPISSGQTQSEIFVKPKNYDSVLLVIINPKFRLYLDDMGTVLAVEPINDDAKSIKDNLSFENKKYETVVKELVTTANDKGFVKDAAVIRFEIAENKNDAVNPAEILDKVTQATKQTATELKVNVKVKVEDKTESTTSSRVVSTENASSHTHDFLAATCTNPKTCVCGRTEGGALGHDYKDGACNRCGGIDPNFVSYTSVQEKKGVWSFEYAFGDHYYDASLRLSTAVGALGVSYKLGDALSALPEEMREEIKPDCIQFEGEYYYVARGKGDGFEDITEAVNTVTVTDSDGDELILTRIAENKLKVKNAPAEFGGMSNIPVGTVLTFQAK